ncbi:protein of unknown function [Acidithiobacillus ferrivorans]|nr:protein of unknown function [Acidithiobacillus ferrivorans]
MFYGTFIVLDGLWIVAVAAGMRTLSVRQPNFQFTNVWSPKMRGCP